MTMRLISLTALSALVAAQDFGAEIVPIRKTYPEHEPAGAKRDPDTRIKPHIGKKQIEKALRRLQKERQR